MASLGHLAMSMAAGRRAGGGWAVIAGLTALSFLPDADVVAFAMNIPYGDAWGHRGATHSLVIAAGIGSVCGLVARALGRSDAWRIAAWCIAVTMSHGILDAFTDGGLGVALLWPLSEARYFAPWRPIPVSPIGPNFLSFRGAEVALTELLMFAPLFIYALWPQLAKAISK